jgi:hypothetical protein
MQLKEFSFISAMIESGEVLKAIETAIPPETIEQVLGSTESWEEGKRKLPSHLVVYLVTAMSLWSSDSMRTIRGRLRHSAFVNK